MQLVIIASITMTTFLRTRMAVDAIHSSYFMGSLFYALLILHVDGFRGIKHDCIKNCSVLQAERVVLLPCMGLCDSCGNP